MRELTKQIREYCSSEENFYNFRVGMFLEQKMDRPNITGFLSNLGAAHVVRSPGQIFNAAFINAVMLPSQKNSHSSKIYGFQANDAYVVNWQISSNLCLV